MPADNNLYYLVGCGSGDPVIEAKCHQRGQLSQTEGRSGGGDKSARGCVCVRTEKFGAKQLKG